MSIVRCLKTFNEFIQGLQQPEIEPPHGLAIQDWCDELGRLRMWAANIGAHQVGQSSLDFRLRDASHIRQQIIKLLNDILQRIAEAKDLIEDDEDDDDVESLGEDSSEDENPTSLAQQLRGSVAILINCLFQMSILVRKPAQHDVRVESKIAEVAAFEPFDYSHVRHKFPGADQDLVIRLGKAITRRRRYLRYRERHAMKLKQGISKAIGGDEGSSAILSNTVVTNSQNHTVDFDDKASDSGLSQTSYAPTLMGGGAITIPAPPRASQDGAPFECPYCYFIITIQSTRSWNRHVFHDLQPYVCTEIGCSVPDKLYATRHEWMHHQKTVHCRQQSQSTGPGLQSEHEKCHLCGDIQPPGKRQARHMARHLQELALFVLPRSDEDSDEGKNDLDAEGRGGSLVENAGESRSQKISPDDASDSRQNHDAPDYVSIGDYIDDDYIDDVDQFDFPLDEFRDKDGYIMEQEKSMRDGPLYSPAHHADSAPNGTDQVFAEFVTNNDPLDEQRVAAHQSTLDYNKESEEVNNNEWDDPSPKLYYQDANGDLVQARTSSPDSEMERKLQRLEELELGEQEDAAREKLEEERIIEEARKEKEALKKPTTQEHNAKIVEEEMNKKKEEEEDKAFHERMRETLKKAGYSEDSIEETLKQEVNENKVNLTRPTYIKVHRKHLSPDTLDVYDLPWEWDDVSNLTKV